MQERVMYKNIIFSTIYFPQKYSLKLALFKYKRKFLRKLNKITCFMMDYSNDYLSKTY